MSPIMGIVPIPLESARLIGVITIPLPEGSCDTQFATVWRSVPLEML